MPSKAPTHQADGDLDDMRADKQAGLSPESMSTEHMLTQEKAHRRMKEAMNTAPETQPVLDELIDAVREVVSAHLALKERSKEAQQLAVQLRDGQMWPISISVDGVPYLVDSTGGFVGNYIFIVTPIAIDATE